jgi:sarcosine oxidase, subunit beta
MPEQSEHRRSMKTDVVIIGGGLVGCAAAYYLARKGIKATVIEKNPGVGLEASGVNGGGVRQHGRKATLPLAMASVRLWGNLAKELDCDLEYIRTGNINVAIHESTTSLFEEELAWEQAHGLMDVRLLTAKECHEIVPGMTRQVVSGKICSTDGIANPMLISPAYAKAAIRLGAQFQTNTKVLSLLLQGSRVCGVQTDKAEIEAETVINAAGPWAAQFSAQVGCPMPVNPGRSQLLFTERLPRVPVRLWVSVRGQGYMRPTNANNIVLGTGGACNNEYSRHVDYEQVKVQLERWCKLFNWLPDIRIVRTCSGITEYTPDGNPYFGAIPGVSGLLVAAAFNGEGFCLGPMAGAILADMITGKDLEISLDSFIPDRFAEAIKQGKPVPKANYPLEKMFLQPVL